MGFSPQDVVTENEFEKKLLADVIPPTDIGVTFDDIGALENVKDTLKELVMLPLQRPELFCKGQLTKVYFHCISIHMSVYLRLVDHVEVLLTIYELLNILYFIIPICSLHVALQGNFAIWTSWYW